MESLSFKRGDTWSFVATWKVLGVPQDLTGVSVRMQLRPRIGGAAVIDVSDASGELVIIEAEGKVEATIPPSITGQVSPGEYVADLEYRFPGDDVRSTPTVLILVGEDVTRDD